MDGSRIKRLFGCVLATVVAFGAIGCSNVKRADYDALLDENNELRGQMASLEGDGQFSVVERGNETGKKPRGGARSTAAGG